MLAFYDQGPYASKTRVIMPSLRARVRVRDVDVRSPKLQNFEASIIKLKPAFPDGDWATALQPDRNCKNYRKENIRDKCHKGEIQIYDPL